MNKFFKLTIPALLVAGGLSLTTISYAKPEYSKKEKKGCTYCHTTAGKKDLNDTGKCYAEHEHSLSSCSASK
jgi:hypothetical protein